MLNNGTAHLPVRIPTDNYPSTQFNDALIAPYRAYGLDYVLTHPVAEEEGEYADKGNNPPKDCFWHVCLVNL